MEIPAAFAGCGNGGAVSVIKDSGPIKANINGVQYAHGPVLSIGDSKKCAYYVRHFLNLFIKVSHKKVRETACIFLHA